MVNTRTAGLLSLLALVLTACAVTGRAEPGVPACVVGTPAGLPATPTDAPVITVDDRVSYWLQNGHTAPLGLAVYADGTVIRSENDGSPADPLPGMTIGRIDPCAASAAVDALTGLAGADFGMPEVTDQGFVTVTVTRPGADPVVLSAYALGIGDKYVDAGQAAARAELTRHVDGLAEAPTEGRPWTPDRLRITRLDDLSGSGDVDPAFHWPLAVPMARVLRPGADRRLPCGVLDGDRAAAVVAALGGGPVLAAWDDGIEVAALAIAVLVPGQPACV